VPVIHEEDFHPEKPQQILCPLDLWGEMRRSKISFVIASDSKLSNQGIMSENLNKESRHWRLDILGWKYTAPWLLKTRIHKLVSCFRQLGQILCFYPKYQTNPFGRLPQLTNWSGVSLFLDRLRAHEEGMRPGVASWVDVLLGCNFLHSLFSQIKSKSDCDC
jgi:hypothetical protein